MEGIRWRSFEALRSLLVSGSWQTAERRRLNHAATVSAISFSPNSTSFAHQHHCSTLKNKGSIDITPSTMPTKPSASTLQDRLSPADAFTITPRMTALSRSPTPEVISQQRPESESSISSQPNSPSSTERPRRNPAHSLDEVDVGSVSDSDETCHSDDRIGFRDLPLPPSPEMMRNPSVCESLLD